MSPRAIQQAPFRVLVGANMPAVLVEVGFTTNPEQERQLATDRFQTAIVRALVNGVVRFRDARASQPVTGTAAGAGRPGGSGAPR
jgi:N-acetylmuramoyl-L-alanine amidase